ncbi:MAG: phosphorylase [Leptolyngbyaceae bacterium]|nr:phosphorylase [Leptolyngbyaceae bacterium]
MRIDLILVPQGAEYQAIQHGLDAWDRPRPLVLPLPMGPAAVQRHLHQLQGANQLPVGENQHVLLLGLAGSLSPAYRVGDVVVLTCMTAATRVEGPDVLSPDHENQYECDRPLTHAIYHHLQRQQSITRTASFQLAMERGITCDRLLTTGQEKQRVGQQFPASCVEMEGTSVLATMQGLGAKVSILRVISDDCYTTIPDLTPAIDPNGQLKVGSMVGIFARQPLAATRLIQGSLTGLQRLRRITRWLGEGLDAPDAL